MSRNHLISKVGWDALESVLRGDKDKNYNVVEFIKAILALVSPNLLPPNAEALRDSEYEADEMAVRLVTGDLKNAISCLKNYLDAT
jgi:hypothetical protein